MKKIIVRSLLLVGMVSVSTAAVYARCMDVAIEGADHCYGTYTRGTSAMADCLADAREAYDNCMG